MKQVLVMALTQRLKVCHSTLELEGSENYLSSPSFYKEGNLKPRNDNLPGLLSPESNVLYTFITTLAPFSPSGWEFENVRKVLLRISALSSYSPLSPSYLRKWGTDNLPIRPAQQQGSFPIFSASSPSTLLM